MPTKLFTINGFSTPVSYFEGEIPYSREESGYWVVKRLGISVDAGRLNGCIPAPTTPNVKEILKAKRILPWDSNRPLIEEYVGINISPTLTIYHTTNEQCQYDIHRNLWWIIRNGYVVDAGIIRRNDPINITSDNTDARNILRIKGLLPSEESDPVQHSGIAITDILNNITWEMSSTSFLKRKPEVIKKQMKRSMDSRIKDFYSYKSLYNYQGLEGHLLVRAGTTFIGVEVEMEKVEVPDILPTTWAHVADGSLKNHGREFIIIPIRFKFLEMELRRLFEAVPSYSFSSRCSVHVHMNARDFSLSELRSFLTLYMIFEKLLFRFSGNRWNNNFCIPLYFYPHIVKEWVRYLEEVNSPSETWYKYFGLNLSPIFGGESKRTGTIEFRHMEGTDNIDKIITWINLIVSLKISAKKMNWEELIDHLKTMNTSSGYYWLTKEVFKDFGTILLECPTFKEDIETCITQAKRVFLQPDPIKEVLFTK